MNAQWFVAYAITGALCQSVPVSAQEAILPQGDPRLREQSGEQPRAQAGPAHPTLLVGSAGSAGTAKVTAHHSGQARRAAGRAACR